MDNAFTAILSFICQELPDFLLAEPVVYFTAAFLSLVVLGLIIRLLSMKF